MREKLPMAKATLARPRKQQRRSWLEERVAAYIAGRQLQAPVREFRFAPPRQFRFDFCWVALGIALECEGGIWMQGRHNRGASFANDVDKYNLATLMGFRVFRITERQVRDGSAFQLLEKMLTTDIRYVPSVLTEIAES